jgi:hypothetical protein
MAASPDILIASCVIFPSRDNVGVAVGANEVGAVVVGAEVVGAEVVGADVAGASTGASVAMGLGWIVWRSVAGGRDGEEMGAFVLITGVGSEEPITGAGVCGSEIVGTSVGGGVEDVFGVRVGAIIGTREGWNVGGPGPGSDGAVGATVGSKPIASKVGLIVGSSDKIDAGSPVENESFEAEESDLVSDEERLGFAAADDDDDRDLPLFADLLVARSLAYLRFCLRFFLCILNFFRLFNRFFWSFAMSISRGNKLGILLFLVLLLLLLLLLGFSRFLIRRKIFSNFLPFRLRPAAALDLSSECDSMLLIFFSNQSELLTFFWIFFRKTSIFFLSDCNLLPPFVLFD